MKIEQVRLNNLKHWEQKLGRRPLAERAGYADTNYLNQLLTGHENIGKRTARKFELALELSEGWMDNQHPELWGESKLGEKPSSYITTRKVPLISWVRAGTWCDSQDPFQPGDAEEWLDCPFEFSDSAFCLRVVGDSMFAENGYRDGEIILVDPEVRARHGDDVVARAPNNSYTFKRLQITPEGTYLLALNQDHPNRKIEIPADTHICGVVTASWTKRR